MRFFLIYGLLPVNKLSPKLKSFGLFGAANRIRTDDLILTKDVLCHLSHSSEY